MQLAKIKVSGFKSFVDPTTLPLLSNLTAIVGPNGCGKSNIIDAVTWVMGESSPKYLRGESLTDVIFNGSSARKAIGQASVELIFDNSDGTIGGEYARFAEISIKRLLDRDSDSSYYLNGTRCRKKDIVELFLGTGIGPRSYSIIGQNMIAKLIEAKPDELRTYIEEAAGISKYKERKHETELRIKHTQENLMRVNDICRELEKQLAHLKQQANVAEKYKVLKQQERTLKAEWYGIEWRDLNERQVSQSLTIQQQETALEAKNSEMLTVEQAHQALRDERQSAQASYQTVQKNYYTLGNEITRLEQEIEHNQVRKDELEKDLLALNHDKNTLEELMNEADDHLAEINETLKVNGPAYVALKNNINELKASFIKAEAGLKHSQNEWDEFQKYIAETTQRAQVEKTNIEHLEKRMTFLENREASLKTQQVQFNFNELHAEIENTRQEIKHNEKVLSGKNNELKTIYQEINNIQNKKQQAEITLKALNTDKQKLLGQLASLNALQQTALGQNDNHVLPWLKKHQLDRNVRLAQQVQVEKGWELAVEKILGSYLQAICVDQIDNLVPHLPDFKKGHLCLLNKKNLSSETRPNNLKLSKLLEKIHSDLPLNDLLDGIYVAESLEEAHRLVSSLKPNESIVTRDGTWVSRSWVRLLRQANPEESILEREQKLKLLSSQLSDIEKKHKVIEEEIATYQDNLREQEQKRDMMQRIIHEQQTRVLEHQAKNKLQQEKLSQWQTQTEKYKKEQDECHQELIAASEHLTKSRQAQQEALSLLTNQTEKRDTLINHRENLREKVNAIQEQMDQQKDELHTHEIKVETAKSQKASLEQNKVQLKNQIINLNARHESLTQNLSHVPPN